MRWEELSVPEIERLDRDRTVLLLPIGSIEQHGRHMPLGTDTMIAMSVCRAAAERLPDQVAVLPPPWYGYSPHHMRFAGTMTLKAETFMAASRGYRRERGCAWFPACRGDERSWRQWRAGRCSGRHARPPISRQGADRLLSPISSSPAQRLRSSGSHSRAAWDMPASSRHP